MIFKRYNHVYVLRTYKLVDRTWRVIYITNCILLADDVLEVKAKELAYMDETYFCTFHSNSSNTTLLGVFNVALKAWHVKNCSVFANKIRCMRRECSWIHHHDNSQLCYYLVEVPYSKVYLVARLECHDWHAFEYIWSDNTWREVESFKKTFEKLLLVVESYKILLCESNLL